MNANSNGLWDFQIIIIIFLLLLSFAFSEISYECLILFSQCYVYDVLLCKIYMRCNKLDLVIFPDLEKKKLFEQMII